ncbi:hypothetical protein V7150_22405 [Neobacillus drentensis]|uniref:hypothetical protein n=1 Tax=Neobacillus drentensis TaxID=220684 RepID=UPI003000C9A0
MNREAKKSSSNTADFSEIVKNAYDKGINETEITLEKLLEDIKADLRQIVIC